MSEMPVPTSLTTDVEDFVVVALNDSAAARLARRGWLLGSTTALVFHHRTQRP
jgi:hypothetical protein